MGRELERWRDGRFQMKWRQQHTAKWVHTRDARFARRRGVSVHSHAVEQDAHASLDQPDFARDSEIRVQRHSRLRKMRFGEREMQGGRTRGR